MRETESCLNRLERAAVCERCAVRKKLRGRSVPSNRIPSDLFSCAAQSHRFTRHRSCGVWHLHLLHCCPAPGAVCWVCRRPGGGGSAHRVDFHSARCSRLSWSWGPRSRVCRTVGLWPCAIIWRARARARGVRTSRCLIRSIGPVAVGPPQALAGGRVPGAGGSRCRDV